MFTKVMVTLDGSPLAEAVLPFAARIAAGTGAAIELTSVVSSAALEIGKEHQAYVDQLATQAEVSVKAYLSRVGAGLREQGLAVEEQVLLGKPAEAIAARAEKSGASVIAMSTHGHSGLGRWMFGSVTDQVLHLTNIPMLIIRPAGNSPKQPELKHLIVCLDGSALSEAVLPDALDLATRLQLKATLVQAVHLSTVWAGAEDVAQVPVDIIEQMEAEARTYLAKTAETFTSAGVACETKLLQGPAAAVIADFAKSMPDSLVVMSTHGRSGVGRAVLGSVADRVIRTSGDAVLVIRPGS